jgi:hypothetical protein
MWDISTVYKYSARVFYIIFVFAQVTTRAGPHGQKVVVFASYFSVKNLATWRCIDILIVGFTVVDVPGQAECERP